MEKDYPLKRAISHRSGKERDDHYDGLPMVSWLVQVGGRTPCIWTLASRHHKDRTPAHGYEATREAAMAAFAKSWRREAPARQGASGRTAHPRRGSPF
jgi:hypothetical protein